MKRFAWLVVLWVLTFGVRAEESFQALFETANRHFEAGDVLAARDVYRSMVAQGCRNSAVYYNLANAYLKLGDIGRAILNYRRAERLAPRDPDIRANLALARSSVSRPIEVPEPGRVSGIMGILHSRITVSEYTVATAVLYLITISLFVAALLAPRRRLRRRLFRTSLGILILFLAVGTGLVWKIRHFETVEFAVAVDSAVTARNGPGEHFTEVFTQQPGYEMTIHRRQAGWAEVIYPNGYTGWVPEDSIQIL